MQSGSTCSPMWGASSSQRLESKAADIDYAPLSRLTTGLSPATVATVVNQVGLIAPRAGDSDITAKHFREAIKIVRVGDVSGADARLPRTCASASRCMRRVTVWSPRCLAPACSSAKPAIGPSVALSGRRCRHIATLAALQPRDELILNDAFFSTNWPRSFKCSGGCRVLFRRRLEGLFASRIR
ncbi:hypothetical protein PSAC2689_110064 [Paraburkholderia sacchari]